jgi:hypothetical protein
MAWEDTSASSHMVFAHYDPSNPAVLQDVVTTTSTSTLPVSFYLLKADGTGLDFRVAWRTTTDAHIHLAFYQGDQNLRFPRHHDRNHALWSRHLHVLL